MKKTLLTTVLCLSVGFSFAQSRCNLQKAYAFFKVINTGTIIAREDNKEQPAPSIQRCIYMECSGKEMPQLSSVTYDNIRFSTVITAVKENPVKVGSKFENGAEILLTARKGNMFWKVDLQETGGKSLNKHYARSIVLRCKSGAKPCRMNLAPEVELTAPEMY